jgi:hypothetical protein
MLKRSGNIHSAPQSIYNLSMNRFSSHWQKTLMMLSICLLTAVLASAADRDRSNGDGMFIATTGRIVAIDQQNKMLRVRGSDIESARNLARPRRHLPVITLPGGLSIHIPLRVDRISSLSRTPANTPNLDEYTVVITSKTLIQDGGDPIRLEDFREGEIISIHGGLNGNILTASRLSKWS